MPSKLNLVPQNFVSQIVTDPANPPATLLLRGFLGESTDATHIRIYLDVELSRFIDAPRDAVLHVEEVPTQHSPLGGWMVWVERHAPLRRVQVGEGAATFLEGGLTAFPVAPSSATRQASRRPMEGVTDTCSPPPTEDASCATSLQQSTCVPDTQPGNCYAPEQPGMWEGLLGASGIRTDVAMISPETAQRCQG